MDETLLRTKLSIPLTRADPASGLVPRPHLIARLNEGLAGTLTLVSAPAGFGKTTLVSAWLRQVDLPAAWLSLDEHDRDVARFLSYMIAALQIIRPDVGTGVPALLHATPRPRTDTLLTLLINDLAAIPEELILVLDDCHTVATPDIDQALSFLINHLPRHMHLVMLSRADPNLSLARLRANGQLNELRSADLRFSDEETARFLEQMVDRRLSAADVAALNTRVGGWIAGVQMTALSLRQRGELSVAQCIDGQGDSQGYIMDYLVDEVLQQQPVEIQTFLLFTAILDELCAPLCAALLRGVDAPGGTGPPATSPAAGASEAQEALTYLEHANLFINPLDPLHQWYHYDPLFADLLRHRLQQSYPEQVSRLHVSASEWYAQAGRAGPAVRHALAAQAFDRAAALVEQVAPTMIQRGELSALLHWLDRLPATEVQTRPLLALYHCWALLLGGNTTQAATRLDAVEAVLAADRALRTPAVRSHVAALRAYLVREEGDLASAIVLSQQALAHLPKHETLPHAMVTTNLAITHYLRGAFAPASRLLMDTITIGQTGSLMANTLSAIYLKAHLLRAQGALRMALKLCQDGLRLVEQRGWHDAPAAGFLYVALGDLLGELNDLSAAAEYLERGIDLGHEGGDPHIVIAGHVRLSWLRHRQGDVRGSHEAIRAALDLVERDAGSRFWPLPPADCYQARLWIAHGNLAAASRWAEVTHRARGDHPITYLHEAEDLTIARLLIAQGDPGAAETLLHGLLTAARSDGRYGSLIEMLTLQALAFAAQHRDDEALSALAEALELAEPEGFVRTFLDEGAPIAELLRSAVVHDRHASYALQLLKAFDESAATEQPLPEPLSDRELEVLRLVAAGYSNQAIANELFLAVSTVKKHINHVYAKLAVTSRTQAVARGRELGLV